jgi:transcriptional regulator
MYVPRHFSVTDSAILHSVINQHPFGLLISATEQGPYATHLPWLLDSARGKHGVLQAHMAKANPHWQSIGPETPVLVVFQGPHDYVSPSWYADPKLVPTWNYVAVHARGRLRVSDSPEQRASTVGALTERFESQQQTPWKLELDEDGRRNMLDYIVAFEIEIDELLGKFKLNQNRGADDRSGVIAELERTNPELARYMQAVKD